MSLAGKRILVVEDEPVVAMCLEDILEALGCITVGPAARLAEGVALAEAGGFDAAVLDINLNGERSDAVARLLKDRGVPFLFASGYGDPPEGLPAPLIEKPYRGGDVEGALRQVLGLE